VDSPVSPGRVVARCVQDGDLVTKRDHLGFERAARLHSGQEQANDGDEPPVGERTEQDPAGDGLASRHGTGTYSDVPHPRAAHSPW